MTLLWILLTAAGLFTAFIIIGVYLPAAWIAGLDNAGIVLGYLITSLTVSAAGYGYFRKAAIKRWFQRPDFEGVGKDFEVREENVRAMVIPVSRREQPEWILRHLKPEAASLLFTRMSRETALLLIRDFEDHVRFHPGMREVEHGESGCFIKDPDNPLETKEAVTRCIRRFIAEGISSAGIFVDATGGKVPMSIGAFQAAEEQGVSSIYVIGTVENKIKDPKKREHGRPVFLSDRRG